MKNPQNHDNQEHILKHNFFTKSEQRPLHAILYTLFILCLSAKSILPGQQHKWLFDSGHESAKKPCKHGTKMGLLTLGVSGKINLLSCIN